MKNLVNTKVNKFSCPSHLHYRSEFLNDSQVYVAMHFKFKKCPYKTTCLQKTRTCCPKFATGLNVRFMTISSHFFSNYINIFHKIEVQTVILRCCRGLKLCWIKSYDTNANKRKNAKMCKKNLKTHYTNEDFFTKSKRK